MDNYLIDREELGKFVDELIKKKPLPANTAEELNALREKTIKEVDDKIAMAIFGSLNDTQLDEINRLLDQPEATSEDFQSFFSNAGIDIEKTITDVLQQYSSEFLGGENA